MADQKLSELSLITAVEIAAATDKIYVQDASAGAAGSKGMIFNELLTFMGFSFYTAGEVDDLLVTKSDISHTHTFASITAKPTTLAGYGITDAAPLVHTHAFADLTSKPTTLAGYGITDAAAASHTHNASDINAGTLPTARMPALAGDVTSVINTVNTTIANNAVSNAKLADMAANTIKSNLTGAAADPTDNTIAAVQAALLSTNLRYVNLTYVIDGGGSAIAAGFKGGIPPVGFSGQIDQVTVVNMDNLTGSITLDIWKANYTAWPPTVANTITAAAKPTISSGVKYQDSTLTGWDKAVAAGDGFVINVDSAATFQRVAVTLRVLKDL